VHTGGRGVGVLVGAVVMVGGRGRGQWEREECGKGLGLSTRAARAHGARRTQGDAAARALEREGRCGPGDAGPGVGEAHA
jgi:hypothetical protein